MSETTNDDAKAKAEADAKAKAEADAKAKADREDAARAGLEEIASVRFGLYKSKEGWSATYAAPFVSHETVDRLVKKGLVEIEPTGGRDGSVKVTDKGREHLAKAAA